MLYKDFVNLKHQSKSYLICLAFYILYCTIMQNISFFGMIIQIFSVITPITTISFDEKAKWNKYALTMPIKTSDLVISNYLISIIISLSGNLIFFMIYLCTKNSLSNSLQVIFIQSSIALLLTSITLPVILKFGVENARIIMMSVLLVPTILFISLKLFGFDISSLSLIFKHYYLFPILTFLVMVLSIFISLALCRNKEY